MSRTVDARNMLVGDVAQHPRCSFDRMSVGPHTASNAVELRAWLPFPRIVIRTHTPPAAWPGRCCVAAAWTSTGVASISCDLRARAPHRSGMRLQAVRQQGPGGHQIDAVRAAVQTDLGIVRE